MECDQDYLNILMDAADGLTLTPDEIRTLKWLASMEQRTVNNLAAIIRKAKGDPK